MAEPGSVTIMGAQLIWRNFAGLETQYNAAGDRNFNVIIPDDIAQQMLEDDWNIKRLKPRDPEYDGPGAAHLEVKVNFDPKSRPPEIWMITSGRRTRVTEDLVDLLDVVDIAEADLILNPYRWAVGGRGGIKAYLKKMYIVVQEDELDKKYRDIEDAPTSSGAVVGE